MPTAFYVDAAWFELVLSRRRITGESEPPELPTETNADERLFQALK